MSDEMMRLPEKEFAKMMDRRDLRQIIYCREDISGKFLAIDSRAGRFSAIGVFAAEKDILGWIAMRLRSHPIGCDRGKERSL